MRSELLRTSSMIFARSAASISPTSEPNRFRGRRNSAQRLSRLLAAGGVGSDGLVEGGSVEVRPVRLGHVQLGVADLPEEVVADAEFAGGADEEVGVGEAGGVEVCRDRGFVDLGGGECAGGGFGGD